MLLSRLHSALPFRHRPVKCAYPHVKDIRMPIHTFPLGPLDTNCHIIEKDGSAVVVDPGGDPALVLEFLKSNNLAVVAILITHMHFDHLYGVAALHDATGAPVMAPRGDAHLLQTDVGGGGVWGFPRVQEFDFSPLEPGEHTFGPFSCTVLHTPGHTPGSVSLYFPQEQAVCSGDVLFYRSVGRTDFPGGNQDTLLDSIRQKLFTLPPATAVYPGHGPASTVGDEQHNNPYCGAFAR